MKKKREILVYVDNSLRSSEIKLEYSFSEFIVIQIKFQPNKTLNIVSCYRSPTSTRENDNDLVNIINKICTSKNQDLLIVGDFNYRNINWKDSVVSSSNSISEIGFVECVNLNFLTQHIDFPTRARGDDTPSTLDLVISNNNFIDNINNLSPIGKSDHSVLHIVCYFQFKYATKHKLNFNKGDYDILRSLVNDKLNSQDAKLIYSNNCVEDQ